MWDVECGMCHMECVMWNVECVMYDAECWMLNVECGLWGVCGEGTVAVLVGVGDVLCVICVTCVLVRWCADVLSRCC